MLALDHWDLVADQVRDDVATNFERIREQSISRAVDELASKAGIPEGAVAAFRVGAAASIEKSFQDKIDDFMRDRFASAALVAISKRGSPSDAPFVRRFLSSFDSDVAIDAIARLGDESDVPALINIARESYGGTKLNAAEAALRLSGSSAEVLETFVHSKDSELIELALAKMRENGGDTWRATAMELLSSDQPSAREKAAQLITRAMSQTGIQDVLNSYLSQQSYYYNVVVILDLALYCRIPMISDEATL